MIRNHPEVQAWLDVGNCLVVPSPQRAAAVRLAHAAEHFAHAESLWASPDVVPWNAWLAREQSTAANLSGNCHRQLSGAEDWLLWRAAVRVASRDLELVSADVLVDAIRSSSGLIDDWELPLRHTPTVESELLQRARQLYLDHCRRLPVAAPSDWFATQAPLLRPTWVLGFAELGSARQRVLLRRGARVGWPLASASAVSAAPAAQAASRTIGAANTDVEFELIAAWCRQRLLREPTARLLVVAPTLGQNLPRLQRALGETLSVQASSDSNSELPMVALEGGIPLGEYPLVAAALALLRCATGVQPFTQWSVLLRSAYLDAGGWQWRAQFERWLREKNVTELDWTGFQRLRARHQPTAVGESLIALDQRQEASPSPTGTMAVTATTAAWAQHFAALLEAAGWPGPAALGSAEQQVRLRFEQLLGEIAAAQEVAGSLDAGEAAALLDAWTQRVNFEVASGDVPVTVTASTDDPLVRYDGIWVAGLSAEVWPASARGDAFVPYATLASAGLTMLSAAGQQQRARAAMRAWEQAGAEVIYSWPLQVDDAVLEASPLLLAASAAQSSTAVESAASPAGHLLRPFRAGLLQLGVATEPCGSDIAQRWPVGQRARHGVRLIQAQSQCPFQATAIGRLQCEPLVSPLDGITPPLHGQIIHHALEGIWKELQDSVALASLSDGRQALVHRHVRLAIAEYRKRVVMPLAAVVWQIEQQRCQQVLMRLLEAESQREAFAVSSTEEQLDQIIGGLPLQLRRDRVDRLAGADPRSIVIDYKTGKPAARNDWLSARPGETQLLCYALDAGPELCAIATLHVHTSGIAFKGVADQSGRLPRVSALKGHDWDELRALWHEHVHALGAAFVAGEARVAPLKRACDYCHLKLLCRVNADRLIDDERTGDDDGENDDV